MFAALCEESFREKEPRKNSNEGVEKARKHTHFLEQEILDPTGCNCLQTRGVDE